MLDRKIPVVYSTRHSMLGKTTNRYGTLQLFYSNRFDN